MNECIYAHFYVCAVCYWRCEEDMRPIQIRWKIFFIRSLRPSVSRVLCSSHNELNIVGQKILSTSKRRRIARECSGTYLWWPWNAALLPWRLPYTYIHTYYAHFLLLLCRRVFFSHVSTGALGFVGAVFECVGLRSFQRQAVLHIVSSYRRGF